MEKKALLAVILSLLVLYLFQAYFAPPERPIQPHLENETSEPIPSQNEAFSPQTTSKLLEKKWETPPSVASSSFPEREVRVETDFYTAVFTTRGAALKSWVLKKYLDHLGADGKPIEMVTGKETGMFPLGLTLIGKETSEPVDIHFQPDQEFLDLTGTKKKGRLVFTGKTSDGMLIKKVLTFFPENYVIDIDVEVFQSKAFPPPKGAVMNWVRIIDPEKDGSSRFGFTGPAACVGGKLKEVKIKSLDDGNKSFPRRVNWAGYEDKYFFAAFFPRDNVPLMAEITKPDENFIIINCLEKGFKKENSLGLSEKMIFSYGFFCGPKDIEILRALGMNLEKAIDFGMFDIIAKPLLYTLKYLNKVTHNYGLAIIIITIIIKIIFFPLTHKSYSSMKAMKDLQPKITDLRKKYKDDKERLNRETINLYRSYKVNPLGGCLPLLVQFPIFIAFYWVLLGSIELRHSPFIFWIKDLSAHDPYYITPILMGISMFIQQKMTPIGHLLVGEQCLANISTTLYRQACFLTGGYDGTERV